MIDGIATRELERRIRCDLEVLHGAVPTKERMALVFDAVLAQLELAPIGASLSMEVLVLRAVDATMAVERYFRARR